MTLRILMMCAAGYSVGVLVDNVDKVIEEKGRDITVDFYPVAMATPDVVSKYDMIFMMPGVRVRAGPIKKVCEPLGIPVLNVDFQIAGTGDPNLFLEQIEKNKKNVKRKPRTPEEEKNFTRHRRGAF